MKVMTLKRAENADVLQGRKAGVLKGHGLDVLKGHGFSRAVASIYFVITSGL
ncbi:MAG: hypothetical protein WAL85_10185 [Candidatus Korobacteraceae bacterium]